MDIQAIGKIVRKQREKLNLTQSQVAGISGTGTRFIIELEQGKPTLQIAKVLMVMKMLGITIDIKVYDEEDPLRNMGS